MTKDTKQLAVALRKKYKSNLATAEKRLSDAERELSISRNCKCYVEELIGKMERVRKMSDSEVRLANLPEWYATGHPHVYMKGKYFGLTLPELTAKFDTIHTLIRQEHDKVYRTVGDGMVHWERYVRPGHKESEFSFEWSELLCDWLRQIRNRKMPEETYQVLWARSPQEIFDKMKNRELKLEK